jgi:hypothetical protein
MKRQLVYPAAACGLIALALLTGSSSVTRAHAAATADVQIVGPLPLPVREIAPEPFSASCHGPGSCTFMVPAGKRLIIESITGDANMAAGFKLLVRVSGTPGAGQANNATSSGFSMIAPATFQFSNGVFDFYGLNHRTYLQVAPGGSATVTMVGNGNLSQASVNLSGSLVPAP